MFEKVIEVFKREKNISKSTDKFDVFIFLLLLWSILFFMGFIFLFISKDSLSSLNNFGGYMNISTSIVGVATVFLLSQAVQYQKKELKAMKKEMKGQRKSIEKEEKLNRTIKYIDEWIACYDSRKDNKITIDQKNYLSRLSFLYSSSAKSKIDFKLLVSVISRYGLNTIISNEKLQLSRNIEYYTKTLDNNNFDKIELNKAEYEISEMQDEYLRRAEEEEYDNCNFDDLNITPLDYLRRGVEHKKTLAEKQLQELESYMSFISDMRAN